MLDFMNDPKKMQLITGALRAASAVPGMQQRSDSVHVTPGFGASPTRITANTKGRAWNTIKDAVSGVSAGADMYQQNQLAEEQKAALNDAVNDPSGMTPQKMLRLRQLGVDAETLKLVAPKENDLGMNQIAQYGQTPQGMRTINQLKPGTFSEEYIAQAEKAIQNQTESELNNRIRVAQESRAPAAPRSRSEIDILLEGTPEERQRLQDYKMLTSGKGVYDESGKVIPKPPAVGKGRNAPVDPKAELARVEQQTAELEAMLSDPKSDEELFSTQQAIVVPAGEAAGKGDNPSVTGTLTGQYARSKKSPMATRLERWGQEQALGRIKELYPASNSDIAMLLSMQPRPGDSRESVTNYLQLRKQVIEKAKAGEYGQSQAPAQTAAEDVWGGVPVGDRPNGWEQWPAEAAEAWMEAQ